MSRVEEARRRAAGRSIESRDFGGERPTVVSVDDDVLEEYPGERASTRPERSPRVQRSISAPRSAGSPQLASLAPSVNGKLVGSPDTQPVVVEQYRRLATSLHELQIDTGLKTIMVTSALPREGKTLTVTNLALTLSGSYRKRVLLVDADLRRPSLHEVFRLPKTIGLSEALRSGNRPHLLELSPLLSVLPAGEVGGDPLSALTSDRLTTLLDQCVASFDWVLLDAPPIGLMPDANVLARLTKAVVFVIGAGMTPHKIIERAITQLGRDLVVGTVLNRIENQELSMAKEYEHYYADSRHCAK